MMNKKGANLKIESDRRGWTQPAGDGFTQPQLDQQAGGTQPPPETAVNAFGQQGTTGAMATGGQNAAQAANSTAPLYPAGDPMKLAAALPGFLQSLGRGGATKALRSPGWRDWLGKS